MKTLLMASAIAVFSFTVLADDGHNGNNSNGSNNSSYQSGVIGSMPGLAIGGVPSGGVPWVVRQGEVSVSSSGRIQVEVQGLLIGPPAPANLLGTTATVGMVGATLVCGGSGGTPVPVADTAITPAPLSTLGNAHIDQVVTLPSMCFAPVVLVRVFNASAPLGSQLGPFIAASGLTPNAGNQNQNQNQNQNNNNNNNQNQDNHGGRGHDH